MTRILALGLLLTASLSAADVEKQLKDLRAQGAREGWTFEVGDTPLLHLPEQFQEGYDPSVNAEELEKAEYVIPRSDVPIPWAWDWRDHNVVSEIKDQAFPHYCGSCWAFGTVAVMESLIKMATGKDVDISEQQLVSCSPSYGTCSGGNFAFGFYKQKGANHEADFPYKASNVSCKPGVAQNELIDSYAYVGAKGRGPTVNEMRHAIYQYGPIAVTVSVSGGWNAYKGGIYNACTSNSTNHIVALVGYDDDNQVWILKNSHGTSWGEAGYMRIKYLGADGKKCNSVGASAMFAHYKKT